MKNIFLILLFCGYLQHGQSQSSWQGSWETQHGHVEIISSKGYVYGLYANVGWLYGKIAPGNKRVVGTFWNDDKKNSGRFEWTLNNTGTAFTGKWAWGENFKTLEQLDGGDWNGTKSSSKSTSKPWTKTFSTNAGELQVIHMGGNRALGLLNEVVLCGMVVNNNTLTGVMKTIDVIGIGKQYGTSFSITQANNALTGYWFKPTGKQDLTGNLKGYNPPQNANNASTNASKINKGYKIRVTWNTFKLNKARIGNSLNATLKYQTSPKIASPKIAFKSKSHPLFFEFKTRQELLKSTPNLDQFYPYSIPATILPGNRHEFKIGVEEKISKPYEFVIDMSMADMKASQLNFVNVIDLYMTAVRQQNQHNTLFRNINMVEVLQYLTKEVNATDFPNAVDGRKRLSNSSDTFWLEEYAGKRKVRGYGDLIFGNDIRYGYSYTIELMN